MAVDGRCMCRGQVETGRVGLRLCVLWIHDGMKWSDMVVWEVG